ncbi:hypothetical protein AB0G02_31900 [Actinosynnema sp. NPDC023658]|uniref:hypothetical protein n=1 Tax=Actinosynnema sp. NPDC023658 TaxID=3155465 RepID=UPI0033FD48EB
MVYDSDNNDFPSAPIRPEDRPRTRTPESRLPPENVRREILRLAKEVGYGPARIETVLRKDGVGGRPVTLPISVIRAVLEQHRPHGTDHRAAGAAN